ncbi:MAG TPA: cupin domain-containing protein [Thermomicrobiales bacterium]|jgi:quercetin dioxygenase-like cupin family protein|nr:cupin domain-containing protein [Thermomicrobiales bacterium]
MTMPSAPRRATIIFTAMTIALLVWVNSTGADQPVSMGSTPAATQATPTAPAVIREVLSSGDPVSAPGQVLEFVRFTIPSGAQLPAHIHPGMQVAIIESGVLSYTVLDGAVPVTRAESGETELIVPETGTTTIRPGDSFHEPEGVIHFGANDGDEAVIILVASLFRDGAPPAEIIEEDVASTPAA